MVREVGKEQLSGGEDGKMKGWLRCGGLGQGRAEDYWMQWCGVRGLAMGHSILSL